MRILAAPCKLATRSRRPLHIVAAVRREHTRLSGCGHALAVGAVAWNGLQAKCLCLPKQDVASRFAGARLSSPYVEVSGNRDPEIDPNIL